MNEEWVVVDQAPTVGHAALIQSALTAAEIESQVRGEHRPSIAGELPLPEAMVEVRVRSSDLDRARAALAQLQAEVPETGGRRCAHCGEESPGNFGECWKCGAVLDAAVPVEVAGPPLDPSAPKGRSAGRVLPMVGLAVLAFGAGHYLGGRGARAVPSAPFFEASWDEEGDCVRSTWKETGEVASIECDHDRDDRFEKISQHARNGELLWKYLDENDNGVHESYSSFARSHPVSTSVDRDEDGYVDTVTTFKRDGTQLAESFDENRDGHFERQIVQVAKGHLLILRDRNGDGRLERLEVIKGGKVTRVQEDPTGEGFVDVPQ